METEDLSRFYPPQASAQPVQEDSPESDMQQQASSPRTSSRWQWIGSTGHSKAQKGDGVSDLFRTNFDNDLEDINDLVTVDVERDVVDAGHDGTLDDLVDVFPEDIMGVNSIGQKPSRKQLRRLRAERKARSESSASVRGISE